jgi:hypothetical protein
VNAFSQCFGPEPIAVGNSPTPQLGSETSPRTFVINRDLIFAILSLSEA